MGNDELREVALILAHEFVNSDLSQTKKYFYQDELAVELPEGKAIEVIVRYVSEAKLNDLLES